MGVRKSVLIFGGGIGGLSAAHELTEPGRALHFTVEVVEADTVLGGKARSSPVDGDPAHPNRYPGEHGFRFFPTFYRHVVDTMERIPSGFPTLGRATVRDHLRSTPTRMIARYHKKPIIMPTAPNLFDPAVLPKIVKFLFDALGADTDLSEEDAFDFSKKLLKIATSSKRRKLRRYEQQSWWDFVDAEEHSAAYKRYLAHGLTRTLVAADPKHVNAKTGGDVLVRILIDSGVPELSASSDRVLDGPTTDVWICPWRSELLRRNVTFTPGTLESLSLAPGGHAIGNARVRRADGSVATMQADYYVSAIPVEEMASVLDRSPAVAGAGERLDGIVGPLRHDVRSMSGLQFYLDRPLAHVPADLGHALYIDTEWALTSIAQSSFWREPFDALHAWGAGNIRTVWSTIASDWQTPFPSIGGISADNCTRAQLRAFALEQLTQSLNGDGTQRFDPASIVAWNLDSAVTPGGNGQPAQNTMKLLINCPDRWKHRPSAAPDGLSNLLLASDYVRSNTDLATMEGANEAARHAVNAILDREQVTGPPCAIFELYYPDVLAPFSKLAEVWAKLDEARFEKGEKWRLPFDLDLSLGDLLRGSR
jgi:putative NAD(P)-binding protein/flavin-dependent amine oxidoreductase